MWNVGRTEFRMWDIRVEWVGGRIPDVRHLGGWGGEEFRMWDMRVDEAGENSGCETSGWNEQCHMSQGRGSHAAIFREDPTLSIPSSYHHHSPSTNLPRFRVLKLDSLFQRKTEEQGNRNRNKARSILTNMLNPFHYFIHEFNNQWVKMEDVWWSKTLKTQQVLQISN